MCMCVLAVLRMHAAQRALFTLSHAPYVVRMSIGEGATDILSTVRRHQQHVPSVDPYITDTANMSLLALNRCFYSVKQNLRRQSHVNAYVSAQRRAHLSSDASTKTRVITVKLLGE